jgi:hypothetical protein
MQAEAIPMATVPQPPPHTPDPQPAWNIVQLFPCQGHWDEEDFLSLHTNKLVEFIDGYVEVLPMPTTSHQFIVQYLHGLLLSFVDARSLGAVIFAPLRLRLRSRLIREPDIIFLARENYQHMREKYWTGADLGNRTMPQLEYANIGSLIRSCSVLRCYRSTQINIDCAASLRRGSKRRQFCWTDLPST